MSSGGTGVKFDITTQASRRDRVRRDWTIAGMRLHFDMVDEPESAVLERALQVAKTHRLAVDIAEHQRSTVDWPAVQERIAHHPAEHALRGWVSVDGAPAVEMQQGERLDVEMVSMPVVEWEATLAERDRARASAIEWANTPIHRLLAAYNERQLPPGTVPARGSVTRLRIRHEPESAPNLWRVSWEVSTGLTWEKWHAPGRSLDEACSAAAEQIEATP